MRAREGLLRSDVLGEDLRKILPIIREGGSDTATFDNVLEFLVMAGRSLPHAILMMIPEAWSGDDGMDPQLKAFYEYHSSLMEPWDGPASIAFTDGTLIGAVLDRNGLRPSRYYVTKDDMVVMASEVGVLDIPPDRILQKGRLQPGRMFLIDTEEGRIVADEELKKNISKAQPYREWLDQHMVELGHLLEPEPQSCRLIELKTPILTNEEFAKLKHLDQPDFKSITLPILYKVDSGAAGLEKAMDALCAEASRAIAKGINVIILSDRGINP